ncbi:MAG: hypothetical protein HQL91_11765 [Magnetococcales bacterium]|nr:hypothetical protein [Magnetococcales bacterium]
MGTGVVSDLTSKAIEVGQRYSANLRQTVKDNVAETLDVKPFVNSLISMSRNSPAFKVDISQAAMYKASRSS